MVELLPNSWKSVYFHIQAAKHRPSSILLIMIERKFQKKCRGKNDVLHKGNSNLKGHGCFIRNYENEKTVEQYLYNAEEKKKLHGILSSVKASF